MTGNFIQSSISPSFCLLEFFLQSLLAIMKKLACRKYYLCFVEFMIFKEETFQIISTRVKL